MLAEDKIYISDPGLNLGKYRLICGRQRTLISFIQIFTLFLMIKYLNKYRWRS